MPVSTGVSTTDSPDGSSGDAAQAATSRITAHPQPPQRHRVPAAALKLDLDAVAHVEGLAEEVAMLRASIRELAQPRSDLGALAEQVKILAELRHQVEALCSTLKAQQTLESREGGAADLNQALDELGDRLGVAR